MNVLNRIGWIIWHSTLFFVVEILGENLIEGYKLGVMTRGEGKTYMVSFVTILFFTVVDLIIYEKRNSYYYSFYPISFFDRNWYVIILFFYSLYMFRSEIYIVFPVSFMLLISNEFFKRWRERKKRIETDEIKKILEHPEYDATKLKLKYYQKNFFVRNWFLLIIPILFIFIPQPKIKGFTMWLFLAMFFIVEKFNKLKAIKDVKEIIGEKETLSSDDSV